MSKIKNIYQGENGLILWPLKQRDGQPLNINSLTLLYVEFIQNKVVKKKYTLIEDYVVADPQVRICTNDQDGAIDVSGENVLEVEYTSELTESLGKFKTFLKITMEAVDSSLVVDDLKHVEFEKPIFIIV